MKEYMLYIRNAGHAKDAAKLSGRLDSIFDRGASEEFLILLL